MAFEANELYPNPKGILVLSGKRKSGKDYVADILLKRFGDKSIVIRLSGPLKERYAAENGLDYCKLLEATQYKELYRTKMIQWGEEVRMKDPEYFCRNAIAQSNADSKELWIISDARRKTDIEYFDKYYPSITYKIRIQARNEVREKRGWKFHEGVDDCESECGLDNFNNWDFIVTNDEDNKQFVESLEKIYNLLNARMEK